MTSSQDGNPMLKVALLRNPTEGQMPWESRAAAAFARNGIDIVSPRAMESGASIAHLLDGRLDATSMTMLIEARESGLSTVLSAEFADLSMEAVFGREIPELFEEELSPREIETALRAILQRTQEAAARHEGRTGHDSEVRACLALADASLLSSQHQRQRLERIGADLSRAIVLREPIDPEPFRRAGATLFTNAHRVHDYILCVGAIEPRGNQLLVALAARALDVGVVFVGPEASPAYARLVRQQVKAAQFIAELDGDMLASAYAGATAFCQPSWAQAAPRAGMQAAAAGLPLVLSDYSGEAEYFGSFAEYVHPADIGALTDALRKAIARKGDLARRQGLGQHVDEHLSWERYAERVAAIYRSAPGHVSPKVTNTGGQIYFDLTATFRHKGTPTGISRLEREAFAAFARRSPERLVPIAFDFDTWRYLRLQLSALPQAISPEMLGEMEAAGTATLLAESDAQPGGLILMLGLVWAKHDAYIDALSMLRQRLRLPLAALIHDLIPLKMRQAYPAGLSEGIERRAKRLASITDVFLTYSDHTREDLSRFLQDSGYPFKQFVKFRMGNTLEEYARNGGEGEASDRLQPLVGREFALYVSSIDLRKNHVLLVNVWRRLIEERGGATPHLVFVGRPFWRGDQLIESVERDPDLRRYIHIIGASDEELDWCYRNATFTLYPSLYEGWGLPISESLSYGKFCIVADSTSTREVAPELTDLIDPYDFRAWLERVALYLDDPALLAAKEARIRAEYVPSSWDQAAAEIARKVDGTPRRDVAPSPVPPFSTWTFGPSRVDLSGAALLGNGWQKSDRKGPALSAERAELHFNYLGASGHFWVRLCTGPSASPAGIEVLGATPQEAALSKDGCAHLRIAKSGETTLVVKRESGSAPLRLRHLFLADSVEDLDELERQFERSVRAEAEAKTLRRGYQSALQTTLKDVVRHLEGPKRLNSANPFIRLLSRPILLVYGKLLRRATRSARMLLNNLLAESRSNK